MAEAAVQRANRQPIPVDERNLTEVDHLIEHRLSDGSFEASKLEDVLQNLTTAVQEAAMPFAVMRTRHEVVVDPETKKRTLMWLGKTAVENAMSGYDFHVADAARDRVDIEVDEAEHDQDELRPGRKKVFISPKISSKDAPYNIAKQEHLGDDDAVRVSWLETDEDGNVQERVLESLLVRDVPLEAWVSMLEDPDSIFGKAIPIEDSESALSVMKVHRELELGVEDLAEGPVSILKAVLPYIKDEKLATSVAYQIERYHDDQEDMHRKAKNIAQRWLKFEAELAESIINERATPKIREFIYSLQHEWGEDDLAVIKRHELGNTHVQMTRELAAALENAQRNLLWAPAAVITNNPEVLDQLDPKVAREIYDNEMLLQIAWANGQNTARLEVQNNRLVAVQNISVGGGCPGDSDPRFSGRRNSESEEAENKNAWESDSEDKDSWKWTKGVCQVESCSTRPGQTDVGPCSVCRNCQAKFDRGEDPTKIKVSHAKQNEPSIPMFEQKAAEAAIHEDKDLTNELYELVEQEKELEAVH